jgi:hypothetical protein
MSLSLMLDLSLKRTRHDTPSPGPLSFTVAQFTLLVRQLDPTQPTDGDLDGLQFNALRRLLRWPPVLHKVVGALGLLTLVVTLIAAGGVTWTTDSPFEQRHAKGIALYVSALYAIAAPVLAALARLPAAPEERVKALGADDAWLER